MERAVAAELANTATIITHTGLFDNIDRLYKSTSGTTAGGAEGTPPPGGGGGAPPPPSPGGPPEPPGGGGPPELGGLPESQNKLENLLLENDDFVFNSSLGAIEDELLKILKD
jgi:hypothetical protein